MRRSPVQSRPGPNAFIDPRECVRLGTAPPAGSGYLAAEGTQCGYRIVTAIEACPTVSAAPAGPAAHHVNQLARRRQSWNRKGAPSCATSKAQVTALSPAAALAEPRPRGQDRRVIPLARRVAFRSRRPGVGLRSTRRRPGSAAQPPGRDRRPAWPDAARCSGGRSVRRSRCRTSHWSSSARYHRPDFCSKIGTGPRRPSKRASSAITARNGGVPL